MRIYWLLEELGIDFELANCELEDTPGFHDQGRLAPERQTPA